MRSDAGREHAQRGDAGVDQARPGAAATVESGDHAVEPDEYPDDLAEPAYRGPVGLPQGDRRAGPVGIAGERGDLAGGQGHPGRPSTERAARGTHPARRAGGVPMRDRGRRDAVAFGTARLPVHPGQAQPRLRRHACGPAGGAGGGVHRETRRSAAVPLRRRRPGGRRGDRHRRGSTAGGGDGDPPQPGRDGRRPCRGPDHPAADARRYRAGQRPAGGDRGRTG